MDDLYVSNVGRVLVDEVEDVLCEESHIASQTEAEMIQVVRLMPDEDFIAQVLDEPLVVFHSG